MGVKTALVETCRADAIVMKLSEVTPRNQRFRFFFGNWFSTLDLMVQPKAMGILCTATFRTNRLKGCPIASAMELKNEGRGSCDYCCDINSGVHVIKWYDNPSSSKIFWGSCCWHCKTMGCKRKILY